MSILCRLSLGDIQVRCRFLTLSSVCFLWLYINAKNLTANPERTVYATERPGSFDFVFNHTQTEPTKPTRVNGKLQDMDWNLVGDRLACLTDQSITLCEGEHMNPRVCNEIIRQPADGEEQFPLPASACYWSPTHSDILAASWDTGFVKHT